MSTCIDLGRYHDVARRAARPVVEGRLSQILGLSLEGYGCRASIGELFEVRGQDVTVLAEVVGLRGDRILLMPLGHIDGLEIGATLHPTGQTATARVGLGLVGRVLDALGRPLDGRPAPKTDADTPLHGTPRNPLRCKTIDTPFATGIRVIDGLLTMGRGQRIGIFAGGGVGKSTLLGMMVKRAQADIAVVALVGERGREVEEFVHRTLGPDGMSRAVVVAATSADPPLVRMRGALYATAIAEYFRDRGLHVLLVMDSLTRFAMALREIGLSIGEPPTTKGYTPGTFAALPKLCERAGNGAGSGAITAIYTVLVEGDEPSEPIADAVRAILDGHIFLSREIAERGRFPAVDVPRSLSRVMGHLVGDEHAALAIRARELMGAHREADDLVNIGAYKRGAVKRLDDALAQMPKLEAFLRQGLTEMTDPASALRALAAVWKDAG